MCLYPRLIRNPKYKENKKNGGVLPPFKDYRVLSIPIGCGNCMECMKKKADEWHVRLREDVRVNRNGKFVTLTFNNESYREIAKEFALEGYELDNAIATLAVRRFTERWRKKYKKTIRHWLITELGSGETEHLHIHGIVWTNENMEEVEKIWKYGFVWKGKERNGERINYVNEITANYITKYVTKTDPKHREYKPVILASHGIGKAYTVSTRAGDNRYKEKETVDSYISDNGRKMNMPIYYRNKLYTEEQREELWLNKLDKEERYVCGIKVKTRNNEEIKEYFKIVNQARIKNSKMGYGTGHVNWNRKEYEQQIRILKQGKRGVPSATPSAGGNSRIWARNNKAEVKERTARTKTGGESSTWNISKWEINNMMNGKIN